MATASARLATTGAYKPPFSSLSHTIATSIASKTTASVHSATSTVPIVDATGGVNSNSLLEYVIILSVQSTFIFIFFRKKMFVDFIFKNCISYSLQYRI